MITERLLNKINQRYQSHNDFPCLFEQFQNFQATRPLSGRQVLHATPIFENCLAKILPLAASGADLVIVPPPALPYDRNIFKFLNDIGLTVSNDVPQNLAFDIVYDCMGAHADIPSRFGAVELTRSGTHYYSTAQKVCIQIDDSRIKLLEDLLGTSDGLIRSFESLNLDIRGKSVLLFGFGKVGKGVYTRLVKNGARVVIVETALSPIHGWDINCILFSDRPAVVAAIREADIVITATGARNIFENLSRNIFVERKKLLFNIGAEDEYGPHFGDQDVFHQKRPANFSLSEPTKLKYLDATFAIHNRSGLDLLTHRRKPGVYPPEAPSEQAILSTVRKASAVWNEVQEFGFQSLFS